MKIDVILDARASADDIASLGRLAERYGLRAVWVSSLLDARDPFTNFSLLARSSTSIRMGPIAVNPYEMHPVRIATALLTLNELSRGRAAIVVGGGGETLEALSIEPVRRVRAVRECVEIIRRAATGDVVDYPGELYRVRGYHLWWIRAPAPLIYVAANRPQMLRMAARTADGIMLSDLPPPLVAWAVKLLDDALAARGRARRDFRISDFIAWHVYEDRQRAVREARQWLWLRGLFRRWVLETFLDESDCDLVLSRRAAFQRAFIDKTPVIEGVPERIVDALVDTLTLTGDVGELDRQIEKLKQFEAAGLTEIALRIYANPADAIRLIGEQVVPAVA